MMCSTSCINVKIQVYQLMSIIQSRTACAVQMRKDRLKRRESTAKEAGLMQATTYAAFESSPASPDKPLDSIQDADTSADEEAHQALLLSSGAGSMLSAPLQSMLATAGAQPDQNTAGLITTEVLTPVKGQAAPLLPTPAAADMEAAALTRQDLITPMKGATAVDLADGSASEDPETWLMGASSIGGATSSRDGLSLASSPRMAADQDMMQFTPGALDSDGTFAVVDAEQPELHPCEPSGGLATESGATLQAQGSTGTTAQARISRLPSVRERIAVLDGQLPLTGQHHGQRQRSPERHASPTSLRVIAEDFQEEMLIGAHHGEQEGSPTKSKASQLLLTEESKEVVLVGSHHTSRQPASPLKQRQQAIDLETQELLLIGTHHEERQRSPTKHTPVPGSTFSEAATLAGTSPALDIALPAQADGMMDKDRHNLGAAGISLGDSSLPLPQPAAAADQYLVPDDDPASAAQDGSAEEDPTQLCVGSADHEAQEASQEESLDQAALAGPGSGNMLVGQNHGTRQKWPRKAPKWLQRVVSLSRPESPFSSDAAAAAATAGPDAPEAGGPSSGQHAAINLAGSYPEFGLPDEEQTELPDGLHARAADGPISVDAPMPEAAPTGEDALMAALETSSAHAVREQSEPDSPPAAVSGAQDASGVQMPDEPGQGAKKRGQRGSRLLQKILSGLSGKTSPSKTSQHTSKPVDQQTDALAPVLEDTGHAFATQPATSDIAQARFESRQLPGDVLGSDIAEAAVLDEPHRVAASADRAAPAGNTGLKGSIESMDSLQMDDLLADTPLKRQPQTKASALPEIIAEADLPAGALIDQLAGGSSSIQPASRKTTPSLSTSRRTQHPSTAVSPFQALLDGQQPDDPVADGNRDLEALLAAKLLPDVPRTAVLGASGCARILDTLSWQCIESVLSLCMMLSFEPASCITFLHVMQNGSDHNRGA